MVVMVLLLMLLLVVPLVVVVALDSAVVHILTHSNNCATNSCD